MSLKTNRLREENPVQLLMNRAAEGKGVVLGPVECQRVAATLIMESQKVQKLAALLEEHDKLEAGTDPDTRDDLSKALAEAEVEV